METCICHFYIYHEQNSVASCKRNRLGRTKITPGQQLTRWCNGHGCVVRSPRGRGSVPGWAARSFTLVSEGEKPIGRVKKRSLSAIGTVV